MLQSVLIIGGYACDFVHIMLHVHFFGLILVDSNVDVDAFMIVDMVGKLRS